jgi:hypothetical protein
MMTANLGRLTYRESDDVLRQDVDHVFAIEHLGSMAVQTFHSHYRFYGSNIRFAFPPVLVEIHNVLYWICFAVQ